MQVSSEEGVGTFLQIKIRLPDQLPYNGTQSEANRVWGRIMYIHVQTPTAFCI